MKTALPTASLAANTALILLALSLLTAPVSAQDAATPQPEPDTEEQAQRNWNTHCSAAGRDQPLACAMDQRAVLRDSGQQIALFSVRVNGGDEARRPALLLQLPLGLSIRSGVSMKIDEGEATSLDIQTCDANGCYVGSPISPELLQEMKRGSQLQVSFQNLQQQEISIPFTLVGFTAAYSQIE